MAVWSAAGAWEGLTTVLWLTEQPDTRRQVVAARAMEAIEAIVTTGSRSVPRFGAA